MNKVIYTSWKKGLVKWAVGNTLYISIPFTWLVEEAEQEARKWKGKILMGGPGLMEPSKYEGFDPLLFHNPCATFTTRGCPNKCGFCAVPKLEPDYYEIPNYRPAPIICDNNFTAASRKHQEMVIEKQKVYQLTDFNQGLEARKFTPELADLLGQIRCKIRFAFDNWGQETAVKEAIDLCKARTTKDITVYCLIGYNDTPDDAKARLELIKSWKVLPAPMRYQPLDTKNKNEYMAKGWTERELRDMTRYYFRQAWLEHIPYEQYKKQPEEQMELV